MKPSERLLERLRAMGVAVPANASILRTRAGWRQRSSGAWSWYVINASGAEVNPPLGSADTVERCLAAPVLNVHGDFHREVMARDS